MLEYSDVQCVNFRKKKERAQKFFAKCWLEENLPFVPFCWGFATRLKIQQNVGDDAMLRFKIYLHILEIHHATGGLSSWRTESHLIRG